MARILLVRYGTQPITKIELEDVTLIRFELDRGSIIDVAAEDDHLEVRESGSKVLQVEPVVSNNIRVRSRRP